VGWGGNALFRTLAFFARPVNAGGSKFGNCPSDFIVILYPYFREIVTGKNAVVLLLIFYSCCDVILSPMFHVTVVAEGPIVPTPNDS
jgi:hypothetical protein